MKRNSSGARPARGHAVCTGGLDDSACGRRPRWPETLPGPRERRGSRGRTHTSLCIVPHAEGPGVAAALGRERGQSGPRRPRHSTRLRSFGFIASPPRCTPSSQPSVSGFFGPRQAAIPRRAHDFAAQGRSWGRGRETSFTPRGARPSAPQRGVSRGDHEKHKTRTSAAPNPRPHRLRKGRDVRRTGLSPVRPGVGPAHRKMK